MTESAVVLSIRFHTVICYKCSVTFAVDEHIRKRWIERGDTFWCPNGHDQHYSESDISKLKSELAREKSRREFYERNAASERTAREMTQRQLIAQKAAKTRLRNRIRNGVCPCCTRSFMNLKAHIKTQHPDFQPDDESRA